MTNKRIKRVLISPEILTHVLATGTAWRVEEGIPLGATMKGFTLDPATQCLNLFVEHEEFEMVDMEREVAEPLTVLFKKIA
jgi:hypothetical protein